MKIFNTFGGIGGNRTLWGDKHDITMVERDDVIAAVYQKRFPNDKVIIGDAYEFTEENFNNGDLWWASPPCQTHSRANYRPSMKKKLPDFKLYSLIKFLQLWREKPWIVENVAVIDEVIPHTAKVGRHFIWSNFTIPDKKFPKLFTTENYIGSDGKTHNGGLADLGIQDLLTIHKIGFDFSHKNKRSILRNCVDYRVGQYILECLDSYNSAREL